MSKEKNMGAEIAFDVRQLIDTSRRNAARKINLAMTMAYFQIGKMIVEDEQNENKNAGPVEYAMTRLSEKLNNEFGRGYSVDNLKRFKKFYQLYQDRISETLLQKLEDNISKVKSEILERTFELPWSHYALLLEIENQDERNFYEVEAIKNNWSLGVLKAQYNSSLYERRPL